LDYLQYGALGLLALVLFVVGKYGYLLITKQTAKFWSYIEEANKTHRADIKDLVKTKDQQADRLADLTIKAASAIEANTKVIQNCTKGT
jgi:hypothetical protein